MASWFRKARNTVATQVQATIDPDSPEALGKELGNLIRLINRNAGRFGPAAVVAGRHVTDVVDEILDALADDVTPDVQAIIAVRGIVYDYLPTTLNRFLALPAGSVHTPLASGKTPTQQLSAQLDDMWSAGADVLRALRAHDANALVTQGNFLHTKFTRSDLDL